MITKQAKLKQKAYQSSLKSRALSVLIYLIDRSNKDLTCFPAIPTMAEQLHVSISTVKRALHELVDAGFIKRNPGSVKRTEGRLLTSIFLCSRRTCQSRYPPRIWRMMLQTHRKRQGSPARYGTLPLRILLLKKQRRKESRRKPLIQSHRIVRITCLYLITIPPFVCWLSSATAICCGCNL